MTDRQPDSFDPALLSEAAEAPPPQILHTREMEPGEFDYNWIGYVFAEGVGARFYLDEPDAVLVQVSRDDLASPALSGVLIYLQRRFAVIRCLEPALVYREAWRVIG
jgi:hypothetical protein